MPDAPYFEQAVMAMADAGIQDRGWAVSNGTLLNESKTKAIIDSRVFHTFRFSIDGATPGTLEGIRRGVSYDKLMRNLRIFSEYRRQRNSSTRMGFIGLCNRETFMS
jgi:hypothetical protein